MTKPPADPWALSQVFSGYCIDAWQRTVLTWDLLRQRGNQYLEHEESGQSGGAATT
jgi:hypothetical protein